MQVNHILSHGGFLNVKITHRANDVDGHGHCGIEFLLKHELDAI
jgi:hypothetical protein